MDTPTSTLPSGNALPSNPTTKPSVTGPVPLVTTGTTPIYRHKVASIYAHAAHADPFNNMLQREKYTDPNTPSVDLDALTATNVTRIDRKVDEGAILVEAGGFAAVACWEPPECTLSPGSVNDADEIERQGRVIYADFVRGIARARKGVVAEGERYWKLSLMGKDPDRKEERGVVRGVMEWGLEKAREKGEKVWLEAGNVRARDLYAYFGFRVVDELGNGTGRYDREGRRRDGGEWVRTWLMVREWTEEEKGRVGKGGFAKEE